MGVWVGVVISWITADQLWQQIYRLYNHANQSHWQQMHFCPALIWKCVSFVDVIIKLCVLIFKQFPNAAAGWAGPIFLSLLDNSILIFNKWVITEAYRADIGCIQVMRLNKMSQDTK